MPCPENVPETVVVGLSVPVAPPIPVDVFCTLTTTLFCRIPCSPVPPGPVIVNV